VLFGEDPFYSRKMGLAGLPGKRRGLVVWMNMICDLMSHCFWVLFWHVNNSPLLDALASLEKAVSPMCWKHKNKSISLWLGSWFNSHSRINIFLPLFTQQETLFRVEFKPFVVTKLFRPNEFCWVTVDVCTNWRASSLSFHGKEQYTSSQWSTSTHQAPGCFNIGTSHYYDKTGNKLTDRQTLLLNMIQVGSWLPANKLHRSKTGKHNLVRMMGKFNSLV
jgi:hypothetical protein